jgi:hypothetical protein
MILQVGETILMTGKMILQIGETMLLVRETI